MADLVTFKFETINPKQARKYLDTNIEKQRTVKRAKIRAYTRDMVNGRWRGRNGETVKFHTDGRMLAVIEANVPVEMCVVRGLSDDDFRTIDTGAARSFADMLTVTKGIKLSKQTIAGVTRRTFLWDQGYYKTVFNSSAIVPSHVELEEYFEKHETEICLGAARGADVRRHVGTSPTSGGSAFVIFQAIDYDQANAFFDQLVSGEHLVRGQPIYALRERLLKNARQDDRLDRDEILAIYIRSWNAFRDDKPMTNLVTAGRSGLTNDNFPKPK